jgi:hypothetical protein
VVPLEGVVLRAWADGIGRVRRAPALVLGLWLGTALFSVPLALDVHQQIRLHLGSSLEAGTVASGVNYDWLQEFMGQANGLAATVSPSVVGFAAVLDNLSAFLDATVRPALVVAAAALYLLMLTFLAGGIIDRYARDHAVRASGFFTVCGVFFFRFLRLGICAAAVYGFLFGSVHPWLFETLYPRLTANMTSERSAFFTRVALYLVFALPLAAANLWFDYAKVRAVVEDRRSMIGALTAAAAFIRRNRRSTAGLYVINVVFFAGVLAVYALVAPGVGAAGSAMWLAFATGQLYVIARLVVKLMFWSSETALFQHRLAHAGYVRRAEATWPESPAAEAIAR